MLSSQSSVDAQTVQVVFMGLSPSPRGAALQDLKSESQGQNTHIEEGVTEDVVLLLEEGVIPPLTAQAIRPCLLL